MAYLGNAPARNFISFERQVFTIVNSQTAYTLDHSVNNENDIRLVVNNVVQEPGSGKAYTASGTTLTLSAALTNGTDEMYCVFLGRAVATNKPGAGSVGTTELAADAVTEAKIADDAVESEHLNDNVISGQTELATAPADTDEFLVSDAGTLKRIDYSLIKSDPGLVLIKEVAASDVAAVTFVHGTSDVVFDTTYKAYLFVFSQVLMAGDEEIFFRATVSGSAQTSSYISNQYGAYQSGGGTTYVDAGYTNSFFGSPGDVESTRPMSGFAYLYGAGGSSIYPQAIGTVNNQRSNGNTYAYDFASFHNSSTSNFDGFTFTNNGGPNISSGNFKLYGLK